MSEISMKNMMCRLCVSNKILKELVQGSEYTKKIWNCFSIQINNENDFPNAICDSCSNKVNEMYDFQCTVRKSDELLHQQSGKGSEELNKFYFSLKDLKINEEVSTAQENEDPKLDLDLNTIFKRLHTYSIHTNFKTSELSMKNMICRLCLSVSNKILNELVQDNEIIQKIWNCFSVKINIENDFPIAICEHCSNKVNEMYDFQCKVRKTDELLHQQSGKESEELNKFDFSLKNIEIKEEDNTAQKEDPKISLHTELDIKFEENAYNSPECDNIDNSEDHTNSPECDNIDNSEDHTNSPECDNIDNSEDHTNSPECDNIDNSEDHTHSQTYSAVVSNNHLKIYITSKNNTLTISASKFKCLTCFELFDMQIELVSHYKKKHFFKMEHNNIHNLYETITIDGNVAFKCNMCFLEYNSKCTIVRHILLTHERSFFCKICGQTFLSVSDIISHERAHDDMTLICTPMCGYGTVHTGALIENSDTRPNQPLDKKENIENEKSFKYTCEICGKGFHVMSFYEQHSYEHTGFKPLVSKICNEALHMNRDLIKNRISVHPQTPNLNRHVCVHCSFSCHYRTTLIKHLKVHRLASDTRCDLCGTLLSNANQLELHKRLHRVDRPFSCNVCKKTFTKKLQLWLHKRRAHKDKKTYSCLKCARHYRDGSGLWKHNLRHHPKKSRKNLK